MTPSACKTVLQDNLEESLQNALELQRLLTKERHALEQRDSELLHDVAAQKQTCVSQLNALDTARCALCTQCGFTPDIASTPDLIAWCADKSKGSETSDSTQDISRAWTEFLGIAEVCSGINTGNGAIIHVRQSQINDAMGLLRAGTAATNTYGPTGHHAGDIGTRSLAEA